MTGQNTFLESIHKHNNMLTVNRCHKNFFRIEIPREIKLPGEIRDIITDINSSWEDIEHLNYIFHETFSKLVDDEKMTSYLMGVLFTLTKSFYVHMSVISKSLDRMEKMDIGTPSQLIKGNNERFLKHITIVRNNIIIHKEKNNFLRPTASLTATDPEVWYEYRMTSVDHKGNHVTHTLKPLKQASLLKKMLKNLETLLIQEYERQN
jgi:hypothetical protein